jgi:elongation factor Ts
MAITAKMVSELRQRTGAAMMDCKKALEASGGDLESAVDHLRKQGLKSAEKKASRETAEGRVFAVLDDSGKRGHLVGVACETDFLSGSENFIAFVDKLRASVTSADPTGVEDGERPFMDQPFEGAENVRAGITAAVGSFGENVQIADLARLENVEGLVGTYIHHDNKQGAIVSVTTSADPGTATEVLRSLCQHIVVFPSTYATRAEVTADAVDRERAVLAEAEDMKSKPENVREKMIEGRLKKFYAEVVLAEQPWILDDKTSVEKHLAKELGEGTRIEAFSRVKLGG